MSNIKFDNNLEDDVMVMEEKNNDNNNDNFDYSDIDFVELSKQNTLAIAGLTDNLSWVVPSIKENNIKIKTIENDISTLKNDLDTYKQLQALKEYIEPEEKENLNDVMNNRVIDLLNDHSFEPSTYNYFFGNFKKKFWRDIKKEANVCGCAGVYTKKMHYSYAIEYAGTWTPRGYGVDGYIEHLNLLRRRRTA